MVENFEEWPVANLLNFSPGNHIAYKQFVKVLCVPHLSSSTFVLYSNGG